MLNPEHTKMDTYLYKAHMVWYTIRIKWDHVLFALHSKKEKCDTITPVIQQFNYVFMEITSFAREKIHW